MNGQEKVHVSSSATILVFMVVYKMRSRGGNFWLPSPPKKEAAKYKAQCRSINIERNSEV